MGHVVMSLVKYTLVNAFVLVFLTACGGSSKSTSSQPDPIVNTQSQPIAIEENAKLEINGVPDSVIKQGEVYKFIPSVYGQGERDVDFTVTNLPEWLKFDKQTGELAGEADSEDAGIYKNISIAVSDGVSVVALPGFSITVEVLTVVEQKNEPPELFGDPGVVTKEGQLYEFMPDVIDLDSNDFSYSIENLPAWLVFDYKTGRLRGVPGSDDVGVYEGILITVTDGEAVASIPRFSIEVTSTSATLTWVPPAIRADGSPMSLSELSGFRIYSGTDKNSLSLQVDIADAAATKYKFSNLSPATYYYAVSAYDWDGNEGEISAIVSKRIE